MGYFLKNGVFLKTIVFPRKYQGFQGLGLPKIEPNLNKKLRKIWRAGNTSPKGHCNTFFHQKVFFWSIFGSLLRSKIAQKMGPQKNKLDFWPPGGPGELQGVILGRFGEAFERLWGPF